MSNTVNFFFELGQSRRVKNAGWNLINIDNPPSIAEHSYRSSIIALIIAVKEKAKDPYKLALSALLHKIHKLRLGDRHKVSANYFNYPPEIKDKIRSDQLKLLDENISRKFNDFFVLTDNEKVIVKDADQIELALEAKEYIDKGFEKAKVWIERIEKVLITKTAKEFLREIKETHSCDWWESLKKNPQLNKNKYISRV